MLKIPVYEKVENTYYSAELGTWGRDTIYRYIEIVKNVCNSVNMCGKSEPVEREEATETGGGARVGQELSGKA